MAAAEEEPVLIEKEEENIDPQTPESPPIIIQKYDSTETVTFTPRQPKKKTSINGGSYTDNTNEEEDEQHTMYTSLIPHQGRKFTSGLDGSRDSFIRTKRGEILYIDLDNRIQRLSRWILCYFIFSIAEMIFNAISTEEDALLKQNGLNKTPYQLWLASDIFLFLGCILGWFSLHHIHDIAHNAKEYFDEYLKYIAGGLFILCGFLQWIAIIEQNHENYCKILTQIYSGICI